jgi:tetratricopeptide (TPR) repeat protein
VGIAAALSLVTGGAVGQEVNEARRAYLAGEYEDAARRYAALAERRPGSVLVVKGLTQTLAEVGRYDDAIAAIERFGSASPGSPELSRTLGDLLAQRGRLAAAESAFVRAVADGATDSLAARLGLARLRWGRGDTVAARRDLDLLLDEYNAGVARSALDLLVVANAARLLSRYEPGLARDALRVYDEAIAADSTELEPRVAAGFLLVERYNAPEAREAFEKVLARNPRHPSALLGLARAARLDGTGSALEALEQSVAVNPNLVAARVLRAQLLLEAEDHEGAMREIEQALAVNPSSLEAIGLLGAARFVLGDHAGLDEAAARAAAVSSAHAPFYVALAEAAARNRRYHDAARFAERATELDPSLWRGYALLGINQLRLGTIGPAQAHLETAFRGDPFDLWTKNTLDLLDAMERYETTSSERFRFVVDGRESTLLSLYLAPLAEDAFAVLSARYGYSPPTPIRVEVFPTHADFSVRTVGLVGIGALGVSFGPVIAMDSPSARPAGEFNWGSALWHEIAHSFHLGMTEHRVPRWFSEGLAVHEERRARTGWGARASPAFLEAHLGGRLRSMHDLNDGFVRPEYPEQIGHSYYQASLVCELIERDWGAEGLLGMLRAYREGRSTEHAVREVLGVELNALDERLERFLEERYGVALTALRAGGSGDEATPETIARRARNPKDYRAQMTMGAMLLQRGDTNRALEHFERAKGLFPEYAGADGPYWFLARIHEARGARERAAAELTTLTTLNGSHYAAFDRLARLRAAMGDHAGAADALDRAQYVSPFAPDGHQRLAALYERIDRLELAVRERHAVLALNPTNRAEALYRLANTYYLSNDLDSARRWVLQALERAPGYEEAQELLLTIHERRPDESR